MPNQNCLILEFENSLWLRIQAPITLSNLALVWPGDYGLAMRGFELAQNGPLSKHQRITLVVACVCLLVGAILRLAGVDDYLWIDELHTAWTIDGGIGEVFTRSVDGNQTPVFFYLCRASVWFCGESVLGLRAVSLVSAGAVLCLAPWALLRLTRCAAAVLLLSLFLLLDFDCVFYASEARPYGLLMLVGALQAICFWCWFYRITLEVSGPVEKREEVRHADGLRWARWPTVSAMSALVVGVHITGGGLLLAEALFVIIVAAMYRTFAFGEISKCLGLFFVFCFPLIGTCFTAWGRKGNWSSVSDFNQLAVSFLWVVGGLLLVPIFALLLDTVTRHTKSPQSPPQHCAQKFFCVSYRLLLFVGLWALVPTLAILVASYFHLAPLALSRYAVVGTLAFPVFAALVLAKLNSEPLRWGTLIVISVFLCWRALPWLSGDLPWRLELRNENWTDTITTIGDSSSDYPIVLAANLLEDVDAQNNRSPRFQAYLKFPVVAIDPTLTGQVWPVDSGRLPLGPQLARAIEEARGGWLIVRNHPDRANDIIEQIQRNPEAARFRFELAQFSHPRPNYVLLFRITP